MNSDSENAEMLTPPDCLEAGKIKITSNFLSEKSKKKYETVYKTFMDWQKLKNIDSFSENVLLTYFEELAEKYKSSSLWAHYSMLRSTLSINNGVNIEEYLKLRALLKRKSVGYRAKKAKTFTPEEINKFINEAPDMVYLATKVALIMGIMGACRANELHLMTIDDLQDFGSAVLVTVPNTKTKTVRKFTISDNFYYICKKYIDLRPVNIPTTSFFLNYQKGKCTSQKIGINKFGAMGKQIAKFLKLPNPEIYTGHCFRRSSATLLVDAAGDFTTLKRCGGWKSTSIGKEYVGDIMGNNMYPKTKTIVQKTSHTNEFINNSLEMDQHFDTFLNVSEEENNYVLLDDNIKSEPVDIETQLFNNSSLETYIKVESYNANDADNENKGMHLDILKEFVENHDQNSETVVEDYDKDNNCADESKNVLIIEDEELPINKTIMGSKKTRTKNFTVKEIAWLVNEIAKRRKLLFGQLKGSFSQNERTKIKTWMAITKSLNRVTPVKRTLDEIRKKFRELKYRTKVKVNALRGMKKKLSGHTSSNNYGNSLTKVEKMILSFMADENARNKNRNHSLSSASPSESLVQSSSNDLVLNCDDTQESLDIQEMSSPLETQSNHSKNLNEEIIIDTKENKALKVFQHSSDDMKYQTKVHEEIRDLLKEGIEIKKRKLEIAEEMLLLKIRKSEKLN